MEAALQATLYLMIIRGIWPPANAPSPREGKGPGGDVSANTIESQQLGIGLSHRRLIEYPKLLTCAVGGGGSRPEVGQLISATPINAGPIKRMITTPRM